MNFQNDDDSTAKPLTFKEKAFEFFSIFIPKEGYFVTPVLMHMNIMIFLVMVIAGVDFIAPDSESLLKWGANFRPLTLQGEYWRLFTCCFLHIGVIHLLMNMYALLYIGILLEPYLGKVNFLIAYLLCGIASSVASIWWNDLIVSAGASGAIFGLYGVFLALLTTNLIEKEARNAMLASVGIFVGFNLLYGLKGGIDNAAHLGGLVSGIMVGYAYIPALKKPGSAWLKQFTPVGLSVLILCACFVVCLYIPNNIGVYDQKVNEFAALEEKALSIYSLPEGTSKEKRLEEIKSGISSWKEGVAIFETCEKLDLPVPIKTRSATLKAYCMLRMKNYELMYRELNENTNTYRPDIDKTDTQIMEIIDSLKANS